MNNKIYLATLASIASMAMGGVVYAQNTLDDVGFGFERGGLNQILVRATEYVGTCTGFEQNKIIGWFRDQEVPVAKKRRVRLT